MNLLATVAWVASLCPLFLSVSVQAQTHYEFVGIPSANDSAVQRHMAARSAMIALEKTQRQDHAFRQNLSSVAQRADAIVHAIREEERHNFWRVQGTVTNETAERFAGEMFPRARPYISQTNLWKVVKRMPKGALLHTHLESMLPYDVLLETVMHTEGMVISSSQDVSTQVKRENATISFTHVNGTLSTSMNETGPSIHSVSYKPNTKIPVTVAADAFPGGRAAFLDFVKSKVTILPSESVQHSLGVDQIWRKFNECFSPVDEIISYEPIVRTFYRKLFERLVDDGIHWVEIRAGAISAVHEDQEDTDADPDFWWNIMAEEIEAFKKTEKGKKSFWGARAIWSDVRSLPSEDIYKSMKSALGRKLKFPELISGYDLVSQEDPGHTLAYFAPDLIWFRRQTEILNVTVPFFFHAGETLGDGNSTDNNLFDALLLNSRRIGHGFSMYKHPHLMSEVIRKDVMLEVCPISNEVLRLTTDVLHHPLPAMIAHGVPTAISNDDPAILGQDAAGLSYDFYETIQGFDNIGLAGLGALAQNSVRWANFEDQSDAAWTRDIEMGERGHGIKARRMKQWNAEWEAFCQWVVDEYGEKYATAA